MAARKRSLLADRKATIAVERNGATIRVDDVPAAEAALVLADVLEAFRVLGRKYPEVIPDLDPVPGGTPIEVVDDDWAEEGSREGRRRKRRVGFAPPQP